MGCTFVLWRKAGRVLLGRVLGRVVRQMLGGVAGGRVAFNFQRESGRDHWLDQLCLRSGHNWRFDVRCVAFHGRF